MNEAAYQFPSRDPGTGHINFRAIDAFIRWNLNRGDTTEMFLFDSESLIRPVAHDHARGISRFEEEANTQITASGHSHSYTGGIRVRFGSA